ncbi:MAG: M50 family metallopeptidase [Acidobacteria bacterium]|nr:M50 family metallopeptidase [Acidobacteriota bacterium]
MTDDGTSPQPAARRFRVATIAGTTIDVRISFVVLAGVFVLLELDRQVPLKLALLWIPVLFVSVLIHELAHAGTIAAFGFGTSRIELGGWGGETFNRRRAAPWQEMLISLAGPASSLALAYLVIWILPSLQQAKTNTLLLAFMAMMAFANQKWGLLNLVPILPLDGGQIVLHGLRHVVRPALAFTFATWLSLVLSAVLGAAAAFLYQQWILAFIALSLVMQNWAQWKEFKKWIAGREAAHAGEGDPSG